MNKIVIVGASSGIGLAVAEAYAAQGFALGLAARRTEPLQALKQKYPDRVEVEEIDVTKPDGPDRLHALIRRLGGMDTYFHVAGIGYDNPTLDPEREAQFITTNAVGMARMVSAVYGYIRDNHTPDARLAVLTSVAGTNGIGQLSAYSASKKCASTYLVALEQRARQEGVRVSFIDIRPGWIRTPLLHQDHSYPMEMTLGHVVPRILSAIFHRRRVAVIDWRWNILVGLWRLLPNALWIRLPYTL